MPPPMTRRKKSAKARSTASPHRSATTGRSALGPRRSDEGVTYAAEPFILFMDDDILFEPECLARLWGALNSNPELGGVNAMITNQRYSPPGRLTRKLLTCLHGRRLASYAGRCVGPAFNLLPEDRPDLPEVVTVDWLNLGCTLYRREAMPDPPFPDTFTGYSMGEDLALSLTVGRRWRLANARARPVFTTTASRERTRMTPQCWPRWNWSTGTT